MAYFLTPEFIALGVSRYSRKRRPQQLAAAHRSTTCRGAQVALQRCPILRAGESDFIRMESTLPTEIEAGSPP